MEKMVPFVRRRATLEHDYRNAYSAVMDMVLCFRFFGRPNDHIHHYMSNPSLLGKTHSCLGLYD